MANIRIDNATGDTLSITLDGRKIIVRVDESITVSAVEKGLHDLTVLRAARSALVDNSQSDELQRKLSSENQSQYVRLCGKFKIDVNSSKSVWTIKNKSVLIEKNGVDALFSGCEIEIGGGKIKDYKLVFADRKAKNSFVKTQLRSAFFPIGIGIILFSVLVVISFVANLAGNPITLGDRKFTYPWVGGLAAIDAVFIVYFAIMIANIFSAAKRFKD